MEYINPKQNNEPCSKNTSDALLSETINYLRFPLTILVIFIHFNLTKGLKVHGITHGLDNPDWYFFITNFVSDALASVAVPLFFVFSGFLFFYHKDFSMTVFKKKLKSRVMTLLVPYILWNTIAIAWRILMNILPATSSHSNLIEIHFSFLRIFNTFFCYTNDTGIFVGYPATESTIGVFPIHAPLWFVRDLIVMIVLSPIIHWLIKKAGIYSIAVLCAAWYFAQLFLPTDSYAIMFLSALFFFSLGAFFSICKEDMIRTFCKIGYAPIIYIVVAVTDALTKGMVYNVYINKIGILIGIATAIIITSQLIEHGKVKANITLANSSFFIYAIHIFILGPMGATLFTMLHIPENNPYAMLLFYLAVPMLSVTISYAIYRLLKRLFPKMSNLLTGGR